MKNFNFYWFERHLPIDGGLKKRTIELQNNGFNGTMYPYSIFLNDFFTKIARNMESKNDFKYIVAIRTYVISPQYLSMICSSLNEINPGKVIINFLTGSVYEHEKDFGGILAEVNDSSSNIDRSKYMLNYAKEFKKINNNNFYLSTTNHEVFNYCEENKLPMIIPYSYYKSKKFNLTDNKYIISVAPKINTQRSMSTGNQDAENFTEEEFFKFLDDCKSKNIDGVLLYEDYQNESYDTIVDSVRKYKGE